MRYIIRAGASANFSDPFKDLAELIRSSSNLSIYIQKKAFMMYSIGPILLLIADGVIIKTPPLIKQ